jgi:hypothetical protein
MSGLVAVEAGALLILLLLIVRSATFLGRVVQAALAIGIIEGVALTLLNVPGTGTDPMQFATVFAGHLFLLGGVALIIWAPATALRLLRPFAGRPRVLTTALAAIVWADGLVVALAWPLWRIANVCVVPLVLLPDLKYPNDAARSVCELPGYPALVGVGALVLSYVLAAVALLSPRSPGRGSGRSTAVSPPSQERLTRAS